MYGFFNPFSLIAQCFGVPSLIIGLLACFFGFEIFKVSLRIVGFLVGAVIGFAVGYAFGLGSTVSIILALVVGVIGAIVAVPLHFIFTFLGGGALGALIVMGVMFATSNGRIPGLTDGVVLVAFVVAGAIAVVAETTYVIVGTSLSGAFGAVMGLMVMTGSMRGLGFYDRSAPILLLLGSLALAVAGMYVQFKRLPPTGATRPVAYPPLVPMPAATPLAPSAVGIVCGNCGRVNQSDARNCWQCGQLLKRQQPAPGVFCANCGTANQPGARHCQQCGQPLEQPPQAPAPAVLSQPAAAAPLQPLMPVVPPVAAADLEQTMVEAEAPTLAAAEPAGAVQEVFCPRCQAPNPPGRRACIQCGSFLVQAPERTCPNCGNQVAAAAAFCGKCGGRL